MTSARNGLRGFVDRSHWLAGAATAAPLLAAAALLLYATKRGFDYSDEGIALLGAQHPLDYLRSGTQAHLVWGPVLDLFGSVQILRIVKLLALLGSSLFFATAFVRAFRFFAGVDCDKRDRIPIAAAVTTGGLMLYVWIPQTPAYNELATISILLLLGAVLSLWAGTPSTRVTRAAGVAIGVVLCVLVLAKWSAVLAIVPLALVAAINKGITRARARSFLVWVGGGVVLGVLAIHVLLAPIGDIVSGVGDAVNDYERTHGLHLLWEEYPGDALRLGRILVEDYWPMLILGVLIGVAFARGKSARAGQVLTVVGIGAFGLSTFVKDYADGGTFNLDRSSALVPAVLVSAVLATLTLMILRGTIKDAPMSRVWPLVALTLTPFFAALGTNNPVQYHAMFLAGCWIAVVLALVGGAGSPAGRLPMQAVAVVVAALVSYMAVDGTWRKPYSQPALSGATVALGLSGPVDDITVSAADAASLQRIDGVVTSLGGGPQINMIALWAMPGITALVGSQQPTFGYLVPEDIALAVQAVRDGCRADKPLLLLLQESPKVEAQLRRLRGGCDSRSWETLEPIPIETTQFTGELRALVAQP